MVILLVWAYEVNCPIAIIRVIRNLILDILSTKMALIPLNTNRLINVVCEDTDNGEETGNRESRLPVDIYDIAFFIQLNKLCFCHCQNLGVIRFFRQIIYLAIVSCLVLICDKMDGILINTC